MELQDAVRGETAATAAAVATRADETAKLLLIVMIVAW